MWGFDQSTKRKEIHSLTSLSLTSLFSFCFVLFFSFSFSFSVRRGAAATTAAAATAFSLNGDGVFFWFSSIFEALDAQRTHKKKTSCHICYSQMGIDLSDGGDKGGAGGGFALLCFAGSRIKSNQIKSSRTEPNRTISPKLAQTRGKEGRRKVGRGERGEKRS